MRDRAGWSRALIAFALVGALLLGSGSAPLEPASTPVTELMAVGEDVEVSREPAVAPPAPTADPTEDAAAGDEPEPVESIEPLPEPAPPPPVPESRERVVARANELLDGAIATTGGRGFTVHVVDEHGREVVSHVADDPVLPASTLKIVTAAASLTTFGPDATFTTRVEITAPVGADGVVDGDLLLVGSGDPVLSTEEYRQWVYPARPRTPLEDLADGVAAAGITRVTGDLVGVADRYDGPLVAEGWPQRYFNDFDARYADGLTVDAGLRTLVTYPEPDPPGGDPGDDADDGEEQGELAQTDDGEDGDEDDDPDQTPTAALGDPIVRVEHASDPAAHAARELARLLADRGIHLDGEPRSGSAEQPVLGRLAQVESPPMEELLRFAVQRSDNQLTDALFRAVGRARVGIGSFDSGDRGLRQVLDRFGIDHADAHFADGSGLSRDDRVTARLLVDLDRAMLASRHATTWTSLMAVTGRSGTLERRLAGTVADGRFAGKTGTLRDVTGLVGSISGPGDRRYHLAVVANDPGEPRWIARTLTDELILLLVADLDG